MAVWREWRLLKQTSPSFRGRYAPRLGVKETSPSFRGRYAPRLGVKETSPSFRGRYAPRLGGLASAGTRNPWGSSIREALIKSVIPAKAGIHLDLKRGFIESKWIPAFAGMTMLRYMGFVD